MISLKNRWMGLMNEVIPSEKFVESEVSGYFKTISREYSEKERYYHNLNHLEDCFKEFDEVKHLIKEPTFVEAAIFGHDIVYDSTKNNNEVISANFMNVLLTNINAPWNFAERVSDLISKTDHKSFLMEIEEMILVDIDLSILGQGKKTFDEYDKNIRKEYSWVPEDKYREGRKEVLEYFLNKPWGIYRTDYFANKYEDKARANLERAVEKLK